MHRIVLLINLFHSAKSVKYFKIILQEVACAQLTSLGVVHGNRRYRLEGILVETTELFQRVFNLKCYTLQKVQLRKSCNGFSYAYLRSVVAIHQITTKSAICSTRNGACMYIYMRDIRSNTGGLITPVSAILTKGS